MIGASNVKRAKLDPITREAIARTPVSRPYIRLSTAQSRVVNEAHANVVHPTTSEATRADGLTSIKPKLSPEIVVRKPPDVGEFFIITWLRTGASNEKACMFVPTTEPTVVAKCLS
jgi:hypothetical protein